MVYELNYKNIPVLATGFTRATNFVSRNIQIVTGGISGLSDPAFPNHVLLTTRDRGQTYATEETFGGMKETSLEQYTDDSNRIVSMYYWNGWNDKVRRNEALDELAYIRRKQGDKRSKIGKYNHFGLGSFIPIVKHLPWFKPDPVRDWCSESGASIHKKYGASWINKTEIAPIELLMIMKNEPSCVAVLNYYKY